VRKIEDKTQKRDPGKERKKGANMLFVAICTNQQKKKKNPEGNPPPNYIRK